MIEKIKSSRLIVGIALIVQAVAFAVHALVAANKRRGECGAYFSVAIIFAAVGSYLVALEKLEDKLLYGDFGRGFDDFELDDDYPYDDDIDVEDKRTVAIPVDEEADEKEFDR